MNNQSNSLVERAALVSRLAHKGQFRRDGVTTYFSHPFTVAAKCQSDEAKAVAYLHDVLEDTELTANDLLTLGFPHDTVLRVAILTRPPGVDYDRYMESVLRSPIAVEVKIADMEHNLSCNPSENSKLKIAKWLPILKAALTNFSTTTNVQ